MFFYELLVYAIEDLKVTKRRLELAEKVIEVAKVIGHERESCAVSSFGSAYRCTCGVDNLQEAIAEYEKEAGDANV